MLSKVSANFTEKFASGGLASIIMEQCGSAIVVADPTLPDCPIVAVNHAFEILTGYTNDECLGRNCRFLQGQDTDPQVVARIRNVIENEQVAEFELLNYRKDGTPYWSSLFLSPV